jgi:hypothetical protein
MKSFKQYITEVQRYEDDDWGDIFADVGAEIIGGSLFGSLGIFPTTTASDADDPSGSKRYGLPGFPQWPWGGVPGSPNNPPPGWRIKDDASNPPPGSINDNFWEWMEWYWQNYENIPRPTTPGNWQWKPSRGWYNPDKKPVDPTRWKPNITQEPQTVEPTPPSIPRLSPGLGSQHFEI